MARGKKTGGRDFLPGNPGGPGQPHKPPEIRAAQKMTRAEVEAMLGKFITMSKEEFEAVAKNPPPTLTMGEMWLLSIMKHGIQKGDQMRLNFMYDRLIGKVKDHVEVGGQIKVTVEDYTK